MKQEKEIPKTFKELFQGTGITPKVDNQGNTTYDFKATKKEESMSPEDFILQEVVTGSDCPYIRASDFPREITYELMQDYAAYRIMLIENQKKANSKQINKNE